MDKHARKVDVVVHANMLLTIKMMLESSSLITLNEWFATGIDAVILLLICSKLLKQKYKKKELIFITIIGLLCSYSSITVGNFYLFFAYLFIIAMKGVNLYQMLSYRIIVKIGVIAVHVIIFMLNLLLDSGRISTVVRNGVIRYDFFLGQPNTCQMYILWTSIELIFVIYERLKAGHLCLIFASNVIFYMFTNSNTSIILLILLMFFVMGEKYNSTCIKRIYSEIASKGFGLLSILFAIIVASYEKMPEAVRVLYRLLDKFFTGRIAYGAYAYHLYGFSIAGQSVQFPGLRQWMGQWFDSLYLDNSYCWLLMGYGIIFILLISCFLLKYVEYMNEIEKICVAIMVLYAVTESYALDVSKCFPLMIIGCVYYRVKGMQEQYANSY